VTEAEWDVALPVAILAGGLGTRLGSSSANLPKALVPVAGEPFVAHQLRRLRSQGVERVVLLVGYRGEQIRDYIGSGSAFGIDIAYSFDGEKLLGTGGALRAALPLLGPRFGVTYGDSLLNLPIGTMRLAWRRSGLPAMMSVFRNMGRWDTSNVVFADGKLIVYDKRQRRPEMAYIDYGFGLLCEDVLRGHEVGETFDLADVYTDLSKRGRLAGYEVQQRFYEIGTPAGLAETENHIKEGPV
jgi:MurNAc alpha-1-phosphate uridylyltransferase